MMKKITLLLMLLTASFGFSQALPFDFTGTLHGFTGAGDPGLVPVLTNGAGNDVLQIAASASDWDNAQVTFASPISLADDANNTLRFSFQSTTATSGEVRQHGVSFQNADNVGSYEMNFLSTGQNVVNVELNFNATTTATRARLVIFTDCKNFGAQSGTGGGVITPGGGGTGGTPGLSGTYIIDNISLGADPTPTCTDNVMNGDETGVDCGGPDCDPCLPTCTDNVMNGDETGVDCGGPDCDPCPSPPTSAATDPPVRNAWDVLSVFTNGVYADIAPSNGVETFGGALYDDFTVVSANDTRRITFAAPGSGMQFLYLSNGFNLTDFTHFHMDVYVEGPVAAGQVLTINLLNQPGNVSVNSNIDINAGGSGTWYPADIALDDFNGSPSTRNDVTLIQLVGAGPSNYGPLYFDNFYFYKEPTAGVDDNYIANFNIYPNPTKNSWTVRSKNENISTIRVYDILGKNVLAMTPNNTEAIIDGSSLNPGLYFAKVESANGVSSLKLVKE